MINGKLGEIYFKIWKGVRGISAHCYIDRDTFTKSEQKLLPHSSTVHVWMSRMGPYREK